MHAGEVQEEVEKCHRNNRGCILFLRNGAKQIIEAGKFIIFYGIGISIKILSSPEELIHLTDIQIVKAL